MNFLDDMPADLLYKYDIPKRVVTEGLNVNNSFFREIFSGGLRNMLWSTIGGYQFNHKIYYAANGRDITEAVLGYIKSQNNLKFLNPFTDDNVLEIPGLKLMYKKSERNDGYEWNYQFTGKCKKETMHIRRFNDDNHGWISWLSWEPIEKVPDHPILQFIREMAADYCDKIAKVLVETFHTNYFYKIRHDAHPEVIIRQTTMMFWAYMALRNAYRSNWGDDLVTSERLKGGNEQLTFPMELIANWYNGTNYNEVAKVYTDDYIDRIKRSNVEVARAIASGLGRQRGTYRRNSAKEIGIAAAATSAALAALDFLS